MVPEATVFPVVLSGAGIGPHSIELLDRYSLVIAVRAAHCAGMVEVSELRRRSSVTSWVRVDQRDGRAPESEF